MCLPDEVQECLQSQEATGTAWIALEQNIIDTAVNEWREIVSMFVTAQLANILIILLQAAEK